MFVLYDHRSIRVGVSQVIQFVRNEAGCPTDHGYLQHENIMGGGASSLPDESP